MSLHAADLLPNDPLGRFASYQTNLTALLEGNPEADLHFHIDSSGSLDRQLPQHEMILAGELATQYKCKLFVSFFNHETHPEIEINLAQLNESNAEAFWKDLFKANDEYGGTSFDAVWRDVLEKNRTGTNAAPRINVILSDLQWASSFDQMMGFSHVQPKNLYYLGVYSKYGEEDTESARQWFLDFMAHHANIEALMLDQPWGKIAASLDVQRDELRALDGTQWPAAVGILWEAQRSRFAPAWKDLDHHTQLTVYRLLTAH